MRNMIKLLDVLAGAHGLFSRMCGGVQIVVGKITINDCGGAKMRNYLAVNEKKVKIVTKHRTNKTKKIMFILITMGEKCQFAVLMLGSNPSYLLTILEWS
jgi:hypothetical protein